MSYPWIWTSCALLLSSETKVLHSPGMLLLFICEQVQQLRKELQTHFLAEGTTKGNSKTSVIHRLTGLTVLCHQASLGEKEKVFLSQISLTINRDNTCEAIRVCIDFLLQNPRLFAKGSRKFSASSTQPLDLLTCPI